MSKVQMTAAEYQAALERARAGDGEALGRLLEGLRPYLRFVVRALRRGRVAGRLDDSDLIQDALLESQRCFGRFQGQSVNELAGWLRAIAVRTVGHALRDHLGAARRDAGREVRGAPEEVVDAGSTPSGRAMREEEVARLATCIERLPDDMQQVLLGRHTDEVSPTRSWPNAWAAARGRCGCGLPQEKWSRS
jgi:RNA polymerase sigma-70 factor, ECF subfamily